MIIKRVLFNLSIRVASAGIILLAITTNAISIGSSQEKCNISGTEKNRHIELRGEPDDSTPITANIALTDAKIISKIRISNDEKWLNVKLNNQSGWVNTRFIRCRYDPKAAKEIIAKTALKTINAIKNNNWKELATLAHPEKGIRFSIKPHIDKINDQIIKATELHKAFYSPLKRAWGTAKNSKKLITLTFSDFTIEFLHRFKYWESTNIRYNELTSSIKHPNNVEKTYPHAIVAEFKVTGLDVKTHGSSSSTLCLVFEEVEFEWRLVGIIHAG